MQTAAHDNNKGNEIPALFNGGHLLLICDSADFPVISSEILLMACTEHEVIGVELFFVLTKPAELDRFFFVPEIAGRNASCGLAVL